MASHRTSIAQAKTSTLVLVERQRAEHVMHKAVDALLSRFSESNLRMLVRINKVAGDGVLSNLDAIAPWGTFPEKTSKLLRLCLQKDGGKQLISAIRKNASRSEEVVSALQALQQLDPATQSTLFEPPPKIRGSKQLNEQALEQMGTMLASMFALPELEQVTREALHTWLDNIISPNSALGKSSLWIIAQGLVAHSATHGLLDDLINAIESQFPSRPEVFNGTLRNLSLALGASTHVAAPRN